MDEFHEKVYTVQKEPEDNWRLNDGREEKQILRGQIPTSVFYILFGLCLALMPVETVNVLCKVVFGLVLIGGRCLSHFDLCSGKG